MQEIREEIKYYLRNSNHPHLEDCLDLVPEENQAAIYNMISAHEQNKVLKTTLSFHVAEDVSAIVAGNLDGAVFSKDYL